MQVVSLDDDAAREFANRVRDWKPYTFMRKLTRRHIEQLEKLGFGWPPDVQALMTKKSIFTEWLQNHPQFQSMDPDHAIYLIALKQGENLAF